MFEGIGGAHVRRAIARRNAANGGRTAGACDLAHAPAAAAALAESMRRLLCLFGYHRHGRVRETGRRLCSTCKDCKSSLVLDHRRDWVTVEEDRKAELLRLQRSQSRHRTR